MQGTIYLHLLILCGIWSQGILGTFADEEINDESSDFLARQKRVVSYELGGARVVRIEEQPYIVHIKKLGRIYCMGTLLSHRLVITSVQCAQFHAAEYKVFSKSSTTAYAGTPHNVTNINVRLANIHGRNLDGIALLTVDPGVEYGTFVRNIGLHVGPVLQGMVGTVSGWGHNNRNKIVGLGTNYPANLRSIEVPIISHQDCINRYQNYYPITEKDICTFHPQRHAGHTDGGAPLIIDDTLVGVFLRSGPLPYQFNPEYPEVFALLQNNFYRGWLSERIAAVP